MLADSGLSKKFRVKIVVIACYMILGYLMGTKSYKVWLIDEFKCIISRDVVFNEYAFYKGLFKFDQSHSKQVHIEVKQADLNKYDIVESSDEPGLSSDPIHTPKYEDKGLNQQIS